MFIGKYPSVFGCDVAGVVEEIGSEVSAFRKGDKVLGWVLNFFSFQFGILLRPFNVACLLLAPKSAAFQTYVPCTAKVTCKLPTNISFEADSVLPLAVDTAGLGLFAREQLEFPMPFVAPKSSDIAVFIFGGSISVGANAFQLAKAAGASVVTLMGRFNHDYCKDLGADFVFDYKDARRVDQAAATLKGKRAAGAYDSIAPDSTVRSTTEVPVKAGSDSLVIGVSPLPKSVKGRFVLGAHMTLDDDLTRAIRSDYISHGLANSILKPKLDPLMGGEGLNIIQKCMDMQRKCVNTRKVIVFFA